MALAVITIAVASLPMHRAAATRAGARPAPEISWHACTADELEHLPDIAAFQCGDVPVPVDYAQPDGPTMSVRVLRRPAKTADSLGPLFVNPGGPGASGVRYAAIVSSFPGLDRFDIIGMDPRGVGGSTRLHCPDPATLALGDGGDGKVSAAGEPPTATEQSMTAFVAACAQDPNITHFRTNDAARDMDLIRRALGTPKITYLGTSYGTELGAAYLGLFPQHVRAAVLDSAYDPTEDYVDFLIQRLATAKRGLARHLEACAKRCAWSLGRDAVTAWDDLVAQLDREPLELADGTTRTGFSLIDYAMGDAREDFADLDEKLDALVVDGDPTELFPTQESASGLDLVVPYLSVTCLTFPVLDYHGALARLREAVGDAYARTVASELRACSAWPRIDENVKLEKVPPGVPVVVASARGDAATPYASGVRLARALDVPMITSKSAVHGLFFSSPCVRDHMEAFMVDSGRIAGSGVTCRDDTRPDAPSAPDTPDAL
ncbi:MAG TPA: alpha/beta hydrolase [Acidimicrobiia bacterium]|nr:alpha/beta hydrolase [Acidimicrobiia bacterium]